MIENLYHSVKGHRITPAAFLFFRETVPLLSARYQRISFIDSQYSSLYSSSILTIAIITPLYLNT